MKETKDGILVEVKVIPNATREGLFYDPARNLLKIKVSKPPTKGKANKRVIELVTKALGDCEIISGGKRREKTILLKNTTPEEFREKIDFII